jgi:hypothetical protein
MLLKFTNAVAGLTGNPLYINSDSICSVYEKPTDGGSLRTIVWGGPNGTTWEVEESLSEAVKIVNMTYLKTGCNCK